MLVLLLWLLELRLLRRRGREAMRWRLIDLTPNFKVVTLFYYLLSSPCALIPSALVEV